MEKETKTTSKVKRRRPPARSVRARENQMISLAVDLAEKQLIEGTASSQIITHYLELASSKEKLKIEKLENENKLLKAKTEALGSDKELKKICLDAIEAIKSYRGSSD